MIAATQQTSDEKCGLRRNLEQAGVDKSVEVHRAYSWDVIANWTTFEREEEFSS